MKLDKFRLEIKIPIFNSNKVKQVPQGCDRSPEAGARQSRASSWSGLAGGTEDGWERAAGVREALCWSGMLERAVGWGGCCSSSQRCSATTWKEVSGGRAANLSIPVTFSCSLLHPQLMSLG